jgi:HK97 family phage major capsid protein
MPKEALSQEQLARMFVEQQRELTKHAEKKSYGLDQQLDFFVRETKDIHTALDVLLYSNASMRAAFNALPENKKNSNLRVAYDVTAQVAEDSEYFERQAKFERAAPLDTASNPGGLNVIQTSLADTIIHKMEELGQIISLVAKDEIPYGDKEYPKMSAKAEGQFIDESTTAYTDIVATTYEDATNGLTKVKLTPRDFGILASYTQRLLKKVSPRTLQFFRDYEANGMRRGIERQILRGSGSGQNATGIVNVATAVSAAGNSYLTFNNAVGILGAADTENIVAVMGRKTWQEFKKLRAINSAYRDAIKVAGTLSIDDIPVIISNNADASVATSGNVILGDFNHFMMATQGTLTTLEDPYTNASTRKVNVYHTMQLDLGVLVAESFATFAVTF